MPRNSSAREASKLGPASRNQLLMQIQADVLGAPVLSSASPHVSALGAAYLAGLVTGVWANEAEIAALETEKRELDAWLATPEAYAEEAKERLAPAIARTGEITWELARREAAWLELAEAIEKIGAAGTAP